MDTKYAKSAYRIFLFWGVCSSLGVTVSTIIDATLVGNFIGSSGLAVANIATPVFLLYSLIGITLGSGAGVQIGKMLGSADVEGANQRFHSVISLGVLLGILFSVCTLLFREALCLFLGATPELLPETLQYLTVVFLSAPVFILYHILSVAVRTDGEPKLAAIASVFVIFINLGLDILFMKIWNWGLIGASASLCIAETVGLLVLFVHFTKKQALLKLGIRICTFTAVKEVISNGFGVGSAYIFQAVVMLVFNTLLIKNDSDMGVYFVAVFGVMYTMSTIPYAVFDGAGAAASTVISILGGEKDKKGMLAVYYDGLRIVMVSAMILVMVFLHQANEILKFFGMEENAVFFLGVSAFRLYAFSMLFAGINTLTTSFWQTIGRTKMASVFSVFRNFVLMLLFGFFLIAGKGIEGLAWVYVISEAVCLFFILLVRIMSSSRDYIEKKYEFTNRIFEKFYPIEESSIEGLSEELGELCEEWEIGFKQAFFINLITEELIVNIMKYGLHNTEKKCYVSIKLMDNDGEYILRIRDNVRTYNPFDLHGDEVDRAAMKLITEKSKYYNYQRKLIFNYLYIII